MAERATRVSLIANVGQYLNGMEQAAQATRRTASEAQRLADQTAGMQELGKSLLAVGTLAAVGVGLAVAKYAEFDQAMSSVQAATHESTTNMGLLRDAAIEAGAETVFSATESANAIEELSKAGVTTADVLGGGLAGSLALASAGELGVAEAAEIAATAMTQFKQAGSEVPHIADLLAAGAGKAQGSVQDLGMALNQAGLVAASTGLSLDETVGTLSAFASAGLLGSDAGTSLKTMLQRLTPQSAEAKEEMERLGVSAYDASGQFVGMEEYAGILQTGLSGLTDEQRNASLAIIFGSDAVRGANVLYEQGAAGIKNWNEQVDDSGYAAETARIKLDNLNGDLERLGGAFDTYLIQSGEGANEVLRFFVQSLTGVVDTIGALPAPVLATGLGIATLTAGIGLLGGGMLLLIPKIAATRVAMAQMNVTAGTLAKSIGKGGLLLAALMVASVGFAGMSRDATLAEKDIANLDNALMSLKSGSAADLNELFTGFDGTAIETNGIEDAVRVITDSGIQGWTYESSKASWNFVDSIVGGIIPAVSDLADGIGKNEAQLKQIGVSLATLASEDLPSATDQFNRIVDAMGGGEEAAKLLLQTMPEYEAALTGVLTEQGRSADAQDVLNLALGKGDAYAQAMRDSAAKTQVELSGLGAVSQEVAAQIDDLAAKIRDFGSAELDTREATRDFQQSIADIQAAFTATTVNEAGEEVASFVATLDDSTQAGRDNNAMLDDLVDSTLELSASLIENENDTVAARKAVEDGRAAFIDLASQMGISRDEAALLAEKLGLIPRDIPVTVSLTGTETVSERIAAIVSFWENRGINIPAYVLRQDEAAANRGPDGYASGGTVVGPGTSKSDSVDARLSVGEEVIQEPHASRNRSLLKAINAGNAPKIVGYANGGTVYQPTKYMAPQPSYSGGSGSAMRRQVNLTQNIYPTPGLSERQIGEAAVMRANWEERVAG